MILLSLMIITSPMLHIHSRPADINPLMPNGHYSDSTASLTSRRCILNTYSTNIRNLLNILNMLHNLRFSLSKMSFHNATLFGSCIIHILDTGCAKF
jgi:hypothetical protein